MEKLPEYNFFETRVLQRAISYGSVRKIKFLLNRGCHPNSACGPDYLRPLMLACYISDEKKREDAIETLLQAGALPGMIDKHGHTVLHYACWLGLEKTLTHLLKADDSNLTRGNYKEGNTCLHVCAIHGRLELLKVLVQKMKRNGIDLNTRNHYGQTALTLAYMHNNMECFKYLHSEGALPRHHWLDFAKIVARRPTINRIIEDSIMTARGEALPPLRESSQMKLMPHSPSSGAVIAKLLAKSAHKQHNEDVYLKNDQQTPVDSEWLESVRACRASPVEPLTPIASLSTIVSATTRLKNLRKRYAVRQSHSSMKLMTGAVQQQPMLGIDDINEPNSHPIKQAPQ